MIHKYINIYVCGDLKHVLTLRHNFIFSCVWPEWQEIKAPKHELTKRDQVSKGDFGVSYISNLNCSALRNIFILTSLIM